MKTTSVKRILIGCTALFVLLSMVLVVHIYMVTRPKVADEHTKAMARIDIKNKITAEEAEAMASWLNKQKGIDHVLCNAAGQLVVFTYFPTKTNANQLTDEFKTQFRLNAVRYQPTEEELLRGCPISNKTTNKLYQLFKETF